MERIQPMNELQIQEKVEDLAGKSAKILECEQNTLSQTEEVLLVNGTPIPLVGEEGARIKEALIRGEVPHCDLVNNMLIRAGIETNPVELETTVNVKSSVKTLEHYQLKDSKGTLVDEKMKEKEDEDEFRTVNVEIWSLEDAMIEPQSVPASTPNKNSNTTTVKTLNKPSKKQQQDNDTTTKKSKFSPLSSIIKPHKNDTKGQKQSKKSQQQQPPQSPVTPTENNAATTTTTTATTPSTNTVPKNKFLSLFSKGKSKDKNPPTPSNQHDHHQHSTTTTPVKKIKDNNKNSNSLEEESTDPTKSNKRNAKNNKKSANNQGSHEAQNKQQQLLDSKSLPPLETKKQHFHVNYPDPSKSLVHVEIDGIPVRVAYETFV